MSSSLVKISTSHLVQAVSDLTHHKITTPSTTAREKKQMYRGQQSCKRRRRGVVEVEVECR
jgi:hypothetical protein